jgi:hypothetical protein
VGTAVVLPLAAPILRPLAKTAIKGGILAYQGAAGLFEGVGDLVAEAVAETGGVATQAREGATHASEIGSRPSGGSKEREVRQKNPGRWAGVPGHGNGWKGR